jgi:hypothetical protein
VFRLDITPEQAQSLADELAHAAEAGLFHPSIVEPIAAGVEGTVAYRAEEYVAAETLDVALRHYAPAAIDKALPFITQLAGAIDFARAAGVGHGALHPRDIFITPEETRATGFGVVDALERVGLRAPVRRPYSAPERIAGREWGTPADVFSIAAIAYELLTARRPAGTGADIGPLSGATVGVREAALLEVLVKAMDPEASRRYPTALTFASALEAAARGDRTIVPVPPASLADAPAVAVAAPKPRVAAAPVSPEPSEIKGDTVVQDDIKKDDIDDDDIDAERQQDEAHHALTLHEREAVGAGSLADSVAEEAELEAESDRLMIESMASASDDSSERFRDEFQPGRTAPAAIASPALKADQDRLIFQSDAQYRAGEVVPAPGSRVLPLAAMLSIGLLVGFAVGYGVGTRTPGVPPDAPAAASQPPAATPAQPGKDYSEQAVAPPRSSAARTEPPATPPPAAADAPSDSPAARRPVATAGRIVVESIPTRAGVMVNGSWRGRTPLSVEKLAFGKYSVRVVQPGYVTAQQDFSLAPGDPVETLSVRLQRLPPSGGIAAKPTPGASSFTGSIYVDSRPRGARVFIDGREAGTTPLTLPDVRVGAHVVRLELPDHRTWSTSTRVTSGQTSRVTGSLERVQ